MGGCSVVPNVPHGSEAMASSACHGRLTRPPNALHPSATNDESTPNVLAISPAKLLSTRQSRPPCRLNARPPNVACIPPPAGRRNRAPITSTESDARDRPKPASANFMARPRVAAVRARAAVRSAFSAAARSRKTAGFAAHSAYPMRPAFVSRSMCVFRQDRSAGSRTSSAKPPRSTFGSKAVTTRAPPDLTLASVLPISPRATAVTSRSRKARSCSLSSAW